MLATLATLATLASLAAVTGLVLAGIPAASASPGTSNQVLPGQTPSQTTLPPSPLPGPTTTAPPPSTTAPSTTTTTTIPKGTGVPSVPVAGPPTTPPPKGAPPPPPPDPNPILTAVDADLTQLTAIGDYKQAQATVTSMQQGVTSAGAELQSAQNVLASAVKSQQDAAGRVGDASKRLEHLAIAAYVGLGFASPAAGPQGVGNQGLSTVKSPGGLSGELAGDAQEMLKLVAERVRHDLADTKKGLEKAEQVTAFANAGVQQAQAAVAVAQNNLQSSQQTLAVVTQAATVPGAAAEIGLLAIPNGQQATDAPTTTAPGSPPAGDGSSGGVPTISTTTTKPGKPPGRGSPGSVAASVTLPPPVSPSILGASMLTQDELAAWFASTSHNANVTVPIQQLAADYQQAGITTGVRFDVAFAQSVVETGYFSFPSYGQLTPADNNFAGIGACDSCAHGWRFPDALTGVSAQMELLESYASTTKVDTHLIGNVGVGGCCPTWMALAGKWASSLEYGISIMTVYQQMLAWVIPQRLQAAGLTAPAPPAASTKGPSLAVLPQPH